MSKAGLRVWKVGEGETSKEPHGQKDRRFVDEGTNCVCRDHQHEQEGVANDHGLPTQKISSHERSISSSS